MDEDIPPLSDVERQLWREQRARATSRRAMWHVLRRFSVWVAGALIAINAIWDLFRGLFGGPHGR